MSFDPSNATRQKVIHCYSPEKIFFRNDVSSTSYSTFESYKSGHYLSEYIQNNELVFNSNKYYVSYTDANNYKTFSKVVSSGTATDISSAYNGIRLILKLSDNTSVSLDLLPYDTANTTAITAKVILSFADYITAYIDADGCVNIGINSSSLITITSAYYNLR